MANGLKDTISDYELSIPETSNEGHHNLNGHQGSIGGTTKTRATMDQRTAGDMIDKTSTNKDGNSSMNNHHMANTKVIESSQIDGESSDSIPPAFQNKKTMQERKQRNHLEVEQDQKHHKQSKSKDRHAQRDASPKITKSKRMTIFKIYRSCCRQSTPREFHYCKE